MRSQSRKARRRKRQNRERKRLGLAIGLGIHALGWCWESWPERMARQWGPFLLLSPWREGKLTEVTA